MEVIPLLKVNSNKIIKMWIYFYVQHFKIILNIGNKINVEKSNLVKYKYIVG